MISYKNILHKIFNDGEWLNNRTGVDTKAINGVLFEHDMRSGFPLLTTKKINLRTVLVELEAFIKGITDKRWFQIRKCFIWDEWASPLVLTKYNWGNKSDGDLRSVIADVELRNATHPSLSPKVNAALDMLHGKADVTYDDVRKLVQLYETDLGPVYGYQWRHFGANYFDVADRDGGIDQLRDLIETLTANPTDRRMIVSAWNPTEVKNKTIALPACHWAFEVHSTGEYFDLIWHQRSVDVGAGLPFNIASYAMLMLLLEKETGRKARYLKGFLGNTHIYADHVDQLTIQLSREPRSLPVVFVNNDSWAGIDNWTCEDFSIDGYDPHPFLKLPIAV